MKKIMWVGIIVAVTLFWFGSHHKTQASVPSLVAAVTQTSSGPTTNPPDPYNPMPLRVGTVEATTYHQPFCPFAKNSLAIHGLTKRINYWTREQVAESRRPGDDYCLASIFDCSDVKPADFVTLNNDPWCGANIRRSVLNVTGVDTVLAGKTLCSMQGYTGIFVNKPENCINGAIKSSGPGCDQAACSACTTDCDVVCVDCVRGTVALLNKVTLGMGDGSGDGEADIDDYLYFHECFNGPVAATSPCQNVFDFDADGDVDETDFDLFVTAYNSGNKSWAKISHPDAMIDAAKLEIPLRVGTDGSTIYHRIWCPAVNNSWQTYGLGKRADFFTWDQVEQSGRNPDMNICLPGTRNNPSGSIQNCTLDDDGDGTMNCADGCPLDANKSNPGVCGCNFLDVDSDLDGMPDCNDACDNDPLKIADAGICGCGSPDIDTDGDGTLDCQDGCPNDPTNTCTP